jgi:hypothetical protein
MVHLKLAYLIIGPLLSADLANDAPNICELALSTTHPPPPPHFTSMGRPSQTVLRQLYCSKSELPFKMLIIIIKRSMENPERHKGSLSSTSSSPKSGKSRLLNFRPNRRPPHKAAEAVSASSKSISCSIRRRRPPRLGLYRNYYTNANSGQLCGKHFTTVF